MSIGLDLENGDVSEICIRSGLYILSSI